MGNRIEACRKIRGWGAYRLADALEVSKSTVYRWESGESDPGSKMLARMADLLGVTVDELLGRESAPTPNDQEKGDKNMGGSNFKPDVTRNGLDVYMSKKSGVQERYSHRVMNYQLEKILALCDATGKRPSEVVNELLDFALARAVAKEITRVGLAFEEPNEEEEEEA